MAKSAYRPYNPARRPGGRPRQRPAFRVVVHRAHLARWLELPDRIGLESAQQAWDHLANTPDRPPAINSATVLRGRAGRPSEPGFSRRIHYELSSMARFDYEYNREYRLGAEGDPHPVVRIVAIQISSH